jgi:hypothetical protein
MNAGLKSECAAVCAERLFSSIRAAAESKLKPDELESYKKALLQALMAAESPLANIPMAILSALFDFLPEFRTAVISNEALVAAIDRKNYQCVNRILAAGFQVDAEFADKFFAPSTAYGMEKGWNVRIWNYPDASSGNFPSFDEATKSFTGVDDPVLDKISKDIMFGGSEWLRFGAPPDNFAAVCSGALLVCQAGEYTFWTESDDGSRLYLDTELVVDNGGLHPAYKRQGTVQLSQGSHAMLVHFVEFDGDAVLNVSYSGPDTGGNEQPVRLESDLPSPWQKMVSYSVPGAKSPDRPKGYTPLRASDLPPIFKLKNSETGRFVGDLKYFQHFAASFDEGDAVLFSAQTASNIEGSFPGAYCLSSDDKCVSMDPDSHFYYNDQNNCQTCSYGYYAGMRFSGSSDAHLTNPNLHAFQLLIKDGTRDQVILFSAGGVNVWAGGGSNSYCHCKEEGILHVNHNEPTVFTIVAQGTGSIHGGYMQWEGICQQMIGYEAIYVRPESFSSLLGTDKPVDAAKQLLEKVKYYCSADQKAAILDVVTKKLLVPGCTVAGASSLSFDEAKALPGAIVVESEHPYGNGLDQLQKVTVPGATALYVAFDEKTRTEGVYDWVSLRKMDGAQVLTDTYGLEKYSGQDFPGMSGRETLRIDGTNTFTILFHSDHSGTDWGWKAVVWAAEVATVQPTAWHAMVQNGDPYLVKEIIALALSYKSEKENAELYNGAEKGTKDLDPVYCAVCELQKVALSPEMLCYLVTDTSEMRKTLAYMLYADFGATAVSDDLRAAMLAGDDGDGMSTIRRMFLDTDGTYVGSAYCYPAQYLALQLECKDEVLRKHLEPLRNVSAIQRFAISGAAPELCANELLRHLSSYGVRSGQVVSIALCSANNSFEMHAFYDPRLPSRGPLNLEYEFVEVEGDSYNRASWAIDMAGKIIKKKCLTEEDVVGVCFVEHPEIYTNDFGGQINKSCLLVWIDVPKFSDWRLPDERLLFQFSQTYLSGSKSELNSRILPQLDGYKDVNAWSIFMTPVHANGETKINIMYDEKMTPRSLVVNIDDNWMGAGGSKSLGGLYELAGFAPKRRAGASMDGYWLIRLKGGERWAVKLDNSKLQIWTGSGLDSSEFSFKCEYGNVYCSEQGFGYYHSTTSDSWPFESNSRFTLDKDEGHMLTFSTSNADHKKMFWHRMPTQPVYINKKAPQYSIRWTDGNWTIVRVKFTKVRIQPISLSCVS